MPDTKWEAEAPQGATPRRPSLGEAQAAVRQFLHEAVPDVHRVDVTRVGRWRREAAGWEAEAVVWQPNATIQALGLSPRDPCSIRTPTWSGWTSRLNVIAYEIKEAERTP